MAEKKLSLLQKILQKAIATKTFFSNQTKVRVFCKEQMS
jgi:hypothetical protein